MQIPAGDVMLRINYDLFEETRHAKKDIFAIQNFGVHSFDKNNFIRT